MINREQFDRVVRLLDGGGSDREIHRATGHARETIAKIRRGEMTSPGICDGCKPAGPLQPIGRCDGCGRRIQLPCCACCLERQRQGSGPRPIGEVLEELDSVIKLDLRPTERARLDEVHARRRGATIANWGAEDSGGPTGDE